MVRVNNNDEEIKLIGTSYDGDSDYMAKADDQSFEDQIVFSK